MNKTKTCHRDHDMFEIVVVEIDEPKSKYFDLGTSKHITSNK
jgi:hypothetical protein